MTEAEMIEAFVATTEAMNSQFEFWLTITFGFAMTIHFAGESLGKSLNRLLVGLYSATSVLIIFRFLAITYSADGMVNRMQESGYQGIPAIPYQGLITITPFAVIMVIGTIAAIHYSRYGVLNDT